MKIINDLIVLGVVVSLMACQDPKPEKKIEIKQPSESAIQLDEKAAANLISLPLDCILQEYPNKLNQVIGGSSDLRAPMDLHPAFYGCFDWHSAVHGHWSLVKLFKEFPEVENADKAIEILKSTLTRDNILEEVVYFKGKHNSSYERTYGWAWILKLAEELHTWDSPQARSLESNLEPLTNLIVNKYLEFLPKLVYPIRVGEHTNTAFGLSFAFDYAKTVGNDSLVNVISNRARDFYFEDTNCPLTWEPSGFDFLSPCLEEAGLMSKVLPKDEYVIWLDSFLPGLQDPSFTLEVGRVSDRTDGKLVHLDGLNFSRAWCLKNIAAADEKYSHLITIGNRHIEHSLPSLVGDSYEGGHWLGSFAIYACQK